MQLTATHRVPIGTTRDLNWLTIRADIINSLMAHLWSSGYKLVGDIEIDEEVITDANDVPLWHEFRAVCQGQEHAF